MAKLLIDTVVGISIIIIIAGTLITGLAIISGILVIGLATLPFFCLFVLGKKMLLGRGRSLTKKSHGSDATGYFTGK